MVWLERPELLESVVLKVLPVPMESLERRERKVIPELLVLLVSLVLVVFKEKSEIRVRWDLRVLRLYTLSSLHPLKFRERPINEPNI